MRVLAVVLVLTGAVGCSTQKPTSLSHGEQGYDQRAVAPSLLVSDLQDRASAQGMIEMATLLPHHFISGSRELNVLGEEALAILATHFRGGTRGGLNVRQGETAHDLYMERLETVRLFLVGAGVSEGTVSISDGTMSGPGMPTPRVLLNQQRLDGEEGEE